MPDSLIFVPGGEPGLAHGAVAALRGDDALARAAADVAAPRLRLLRSLRDAHAETCTRIEALRAAAADAAETSPLARLLGEAEEQLRRLEQIFAELRERPANGRRRLGDLPSMLDGRPREWLALLAEEEARGAEEAAALRELASAAGHHLAARLLDLNAEERLAAARDLAAGLRPDRATRH